MGYTFKSDFCRDGDKSKHQSSRDEEPLQRQFLSEGHVRVRPSPQMGKSEVWSLKSLKYVICVPLCALSVHLLYHPSPMAAAVVVKEIGENVDDK